MEKLTGAQSIALREQLAAFMKTAREFGHGREALHIMACVMQYELNGTNREEYPYNRPLEYIMRAVSFALDVGTLDGTPLDQQQIGYLENKLVDNAIPELLKLAGKS